MFSRTISLREAEQLTGLPCPLIEALAESGEVPCETRSEGLYVGKAALLGWCRLFASILGAVVHGNPARRLVARYPLGISFGWRRLVC